MSDAAEMFDVERENIADNSQSLVKCAICQDVIAKNNISYVYLCMHEYCFDCLKQWCEVKAECPLCKQKIEKILHSVKSPQTYKEFVPAPTTGQSLRVQFEDSFDFNQTFDSDNDTLLSPGSPPPLVARDIFRMLQPVVRIAERLNIDALNSESSEPTVIESDESDEEVSDEEPEENSRDESNDESESSDIAIIESQQSIISISSDSDSEVADIIDGLRQSVTRNANVTRFLLNRVMSTPSPPSTPSTQSTQSLYFSPSSSPESW